MLWRKEMENYQFLFDGIKNDAIKQRAYVSLEYYIDKATFYKWIWNILSFLGIVLPAIATVLTCSAEAATEKIAKVTALTSIVSGSLALFKCADKKNAYRNSAENLKGELSEYLSETGRYQNRSADEKDQLLSESLEQIIKKGYSKIESLESNTKNVT